MTQVTWIEHAEYDESAVHPLYRRLLRSGMALGARRWVDALQRHCNSLTALPSSAVLSGGGSPGKSPLLYRSSGLSPRRSLHSSR